MTRPHPRLRTTTIVLRENDVPQGLSISAACQACGAPFEFVGIETSATVLVSEDRRELKVLIREDVDWREG